VSLAPVITCQTNKRVHFEFVNIARINGSAAVSCNKWKGMEIVCACGGGGVCDSRSPFEWELAQKLKP
jgi:hypothetical protein